MKRHLYIIIIPVFLSGCSLIHFLSTSEPKNEEENEYNKFLKDLSVTTINSFQIKTDYYDSLSKNKKYCLNMYKFNRGTGTSPVQIRMYNRKGMLMAGWEQCYGDLHYFNLFDSVPIKCIKSHPTNFSLSLWNDLNMIKMDSTMKETVKKEIQSHDYSIILLYSVWAGWYSKDAIRKTSKYVNSHKNIALFYVNIANKNVYCR